MKNKKSDSKVQGTKETKKENVNSNVQTNVEKEQIQKELTKDVIVQHAQKKYLLDYQNLSEKEQKKERSKRRNKLLSFTTLHFQLMNAKDKEKELEDLKNTFKQFIHDNYVLAFNNVSAKDLYNAKDEKKIVDIQMLIDFCK